MSGRSWAASGRPRATPREPRPAGSWGLAIERARAAWDGLTGGPPPRGRYSDVAAAAILATAVALWSDVAASMSGDED